MSAITRLAFLTLVAVFGCAGVETCALAAGPAATSSGPTVGPVLENGSVALVFDRGSGSLVALRNKLAGETYSIRDDRFCITAEEFQIEQLAAKLVSVELQAESWKAKYEVGPLRAEVVYMLGGGHSFAQKRITLRVGRDCRLKKILVSRLAFSAPDLEIVRYRYPQFGRSPGTEPISTFFGRTPRGGFCTGLEMPFDASSLEDRQVALAYAPSLKIKAGEELACAPAYFGVYRRTPADDQPPANPPMRSSSVAVPPGTKEVLPLPSESEAMVATTSVRFARISPIGPGRARWTARRTSRGDRGLVFLFNPSRQPLSASFVLNEQCIGLKSEGRFAVWQEYPQSNRRIEAEHKASVEWQVLPESAAVLRIEKTANK